MLANFGKYAISDCPFIIMFAWHQEMFAQHDEVLFAYDLLLSKRDTSLGIMNCVT